MPNYKIISSPSEPIYAVDINEGASFASDGKFYTVSTGAVNVAPAAGFLVLDLRNPQNSGKTLYISGVLG